MAVKRSRLTGRCSRPVAGRTHAIVARPRAAGLLSAYLVRQETSARPFVCLSATAATLLFLVLGLVSGCGRLRSSTEKELSDNLRLTLTCTTGMYPGKVSFGLYMSSIGDTVWPGGRPIVLVANEQPLSTPMEWDLYGAITRGYYEYKRGYLWHRTPDELAEWLGGPGTYRVVARLGPVQSTEVRLSIGQDHVVEIQETADKPKGP
jgi:hypothetical protein